jgi:hypothetical protein
MILRHRARTVEGLNRRVKEAREQERIHAERVKTASDAVRRKAEEAEKERQANARAILTAKLSKQCTVLENELQALLAEVRRPGTGDLWNTAIVKSARDRAVKMLQQGLTLIEQARQQSLTMPERAREAVGSIMVCKYAGAQFLEYAKYDLMAVAKSAYRMMSAQTGPKLYEAYNAHYGHEVRTDVGRLLAGLAALSIQLEERLNAVDPKGERLGSAKIKLAQFDMDISVLKKRVETNPGEALNALVAHQETLNGIDRDIERARSRQAVVEAHEHGETVEIESAPREGDEADEMVVTDEMVGTDVTPPLPNVAAA